MIYADTAYYKDSFLLGRKPALPLGEFPFWEKKARQLIDFYTFHRVDESKLETFKESLGQCVCELAEHVYINEGSENKKSESISGRSVSYLQGAEYRICQKHLFGTGLMYRGQGYVT